MAQRELHPSALGSEDGQECVSPSLAELNASS
jgi:hypothetical protein